MEYEYRVIVVGHTPIAGAGCVEPFSPINTSLFDPQMEKKRNSGEIEDCHHLAMRYRAEATEFTRR